MDEFAQTRGADDLFDDEIIPVAAEEQPQPEPKLHETPEKQDNTQPAHDVPTQQPQDQDANQGRKRGAPLWQRGKGRTPGKSTGSPDDVAQEVNTEGVETEDAKSGPKPSNGDASKHFAVRGDRSATGGVRKPKLTSEELEKKIAAAREKSAKVAAAHARAEADQASFLKREEVAAEKRRQEAEDRRAMDSERAQNRQRKLNAATGREWDVSKHEEDFSSRGKGQYRRGMHGAVTGHVRGDFETIPGRDQDHPRGRRRGGRGGRSRGRGDPNPPRASNEPKPTPSAPVVTSETEFPSLDGGKKDQASGVTSPTPADQTEAKSPVTGGSWADQVEESH